MIQDSVVYYQYDQKIETIANIIVKYAIEIQF